MARSMLECALQSSHVGPKVREFQGLQIATRLERRLNAVGGRHRRERLALRDRDRRSWLDAVDDRGRAMLDERRPAVEVAPLK